MKAISWDSTYSVKVAQFDDDHKQLFMLINNLHEAMGAGLGAEVVQEVVEQLKAYTRSHFSAEEELMEQEGYSGLDAHVREHRKFEKDIDQFQHDLKQGGDVHLLQVAAVLNLWLIKHIKQTDQQYSDHFNAAGIS